MSEARRELARATRWRVALVGAAALVLGSALATMLTWYGTRAAPPRVTRTTITATGAAALSINGTDRDLALTPDGTRVVYAGDGGRQLFVRRLDSLDPTTLPRGSQLRGVFVSPDGQWVGYIDNSITLKKVAIAGGPPVTLLAMDGASRGATWGPDDTIIFATLNDTTGLQRVAAAGGPATVLTRPDRARGEADHLWPEMLPGGRAVLFTITPVGGGLDAAQVAVLDLATGVQTVVVPGGHHAH